MVLVGERREGKMMSVRKTVFVLCWVWKRERERVIQMMGGNNMSGFGVRRREEVKG